MSSTDSLEAVLQDRDGRRTLTAAELAPRIGCGSRATATILASLAMEGLAQRDEAGGWSMTVQARLRFGAALRGLSLEDPDRSSRARPRRRKP